MVNVVVGVLKKDDKYLIAQRKKGAHQELKWEFPGGKPENSETNQEALIREYKEELDLDITVEEFICNLIFKYPVMEVNIHAYYVEAENIQDIKINVHENIKWISKPEFSSYDFVGSNYKIIENLA